MSTMMPFLSLDQPGPEVQSWVSRQLAAAGFRVVQTFDLQVARLAHENCTCPHHGTDDCDCQLIVLLIYTGSEEPSTLIIHSRDHSTWLSVAGPAAKCAEPRPEQVIERLILANAPHIATRSEAGHEARTAD